MTRFCAFISFPCLIGFAFVGKEFIIITVGEKWLDCLFFFQIFCLWGSISFLWTLFTNLLLSHNRSDIYMWGTISFFSLSLITSLSLLHLGMKPVVTAYISCYCLWLFIWYYFVHKITNISMWHVIKDIFPYFMITTGSIFVAWLITKDITNIYVRFSLKILITAIIYLSVMWKSNSVIMQECIKFAKEKILHIS